MSKALIASLLLAATLSGCGASPTLFKQATLTEEGLNFASQAAEPARAVELLAASSDGTRAEIEYAVLRGATPHRRRLSINFNGEPQNPEAWQIRQSTLNGVSVSRGTLQGADREMIKQELAELKLQVVPEAAATASAAAPAIGASALQGALAAPTRRNRIEFHVSGEASRQALLEAVKQAKTSFYIETFIWHDDMSGRELLDALAARKREIEAAGGTFDVKILIDAIGLRFSGSNDKAILPAMRAQGFEVREFSPYFVSGGRFAPITHHKLYIADGTRVITGGRNIGDEYLRAVYGGKDGLLMLGWHDLLYSVFGEETGRLRDEFLKNWERAGGKRPTRLAPVEPDATGNAAVETVTTDPHARSYGLREAHERLLSSAEREVLMIYPYFSDDRLMKSIIEAKRRKPSLAIKVLLPGVRQADKQGGMFELLNEESALQLLAVGAEIRMFSGEPGTERFSHFKGMAVDDDILSIGSANADARTYKNNHELNTLIQDVDTAKDFNRQVIAPDWAAARPVTQAELQKSKLSRKVARKVLDFFDFLL